MVLLHDFFLFCLTFLHPNKISLLYWVQSKGRSLPWFTVSIWNCLHAPGKAKLVTAKKGSFPLLSSECSSKNPKFWWTVSRHLTCLYEFVDIISCIWFDIASSLYSKSSGSSFGGICNDVSLFALLGWVCHQKQFLLCKPGSDFSAFLVWISLGII